jgi:hypothetical protein
MTPSTPLQFPLELHAFLRQLVGSNSEKPSRNQEFARVEAYWHLGRIIVEIEQGGHPRAEYGIELINQLSQELQREYGKGYRPTNLWWFKQFYLAFPILHAVRGEFIDIRKILRTELTWTHYRQLISLTVPQERHFYLHTAADERWSTRTLSKLIHSRYYHQVALGEDALVERPSSLAATSVPPRNQNRRSRLARARKALLSQPNWALVDRNTLSTPRDPWKPDALFYQIDWGCHVGLWLLDAAPAGVESVREQLRAWRKASSPTLARSPIGLVLNNRNAFQVITLENDEGPNAEQLRCIPALT